jgi:hypothetical protein
MRELAVAALLASSACGPMSGLNDVTTKPLPDSATTIEQANLLLAPVADAEGLLGREVHTSEDGNWTIADARKPGCTVTVKRTAAKFEVDKRVDVSSVTSLAAGFRELVSASVEYGEAEKVDIKVKNQELVEVDRIDGDCGALIVNKVYVGSGERTFVRTKKASGEISGSIQGVTPKLGHSAEGELADRLAWEGDQAYGFTYTEASKHASLGLKLSMPSILKNGEQLKLKLATNRKAWLVVYYLDANGAGAVLWPSAEEPEPTAEAQRPAALPSAAENDAGIALQAQVARPGEASRETLIAYAFENKADFDRVKPPAGETRGDGAALAAELTDKIDELASNSWSRSIAHYVIEP